MNDNIETGSEAVIPARRDDLLVQIEQEGREREYDLLTAIVPPERADELRGALAKAKSLFPHLGVTQSPNDTLAQLVAYKGVFETFTPAGQSRPVVIVLHEEPTATWVLKYKNYLVFEPEKGLVHKVIKTAQKPTEGPPYLTLAISTLSFNEYGIPEMEKASETIYPKSKEE